MPVNYSFYLTFASNPPHVTVLRTLVPKEALWALNSSLYVTLASYPHVCLLYDSL